MFKILQELLSLNLTETQIDDVQEPGWYAHDSTGKVVEGPVSKKSDLTALVRNNEGGEIGIVQITAHD